MTLIVSYCFYLTVSLAAHDGDFNTSMAAQPIVLILEYFCPNADWLATDAVAAPPYPGLLRPPGCSGSGKLATQHSLPLNQTTDWFRHSVNQ